MPPVIRIENLSKSYRIAHGRQRGQYRTLRESLSELAAIPLRRLRGAGNEQIEEFWALKDVNLEVEQGEVVGIIGRNGAGKSTLLKILSRITPPTHGRVELRGRVGSLLEVGTGFHPELTGRENVFLNGSILGMSHREILKKFDEIVSFSGVEKFLDTPVKRYSSGMYVRLAFAVAAHLEPEILIVDEVLAVGDVEFQKKCIGKMRDFSHGGRTVFFVSHNMSAVTNLCSTALLLDRGQVTHSGSAKSIVRHYLSAALPTVINGTPLASRTDRSGNGKVKITSFRIEDADGHELHEVLTGMDVTLVIGYETKAGDSFEKVDPGISVHAESGETVFVHYSSYNGEYMQAPGPRGELRFSLKRLRLSPGRYVVGSRITVSGEEADWPRDGIAFMVVEPGDFYGTGSRGCEGTTLVLIEGCWGVRRTP